MRRLLIALLFATAPCASYAAETPNFDLTIKNHAFTPQTLNVPADKPFKVTVKNEDASAEEFESHDLKREKVIAGNGTGIVSLGPLKPGSYAFVGEFHEDTAKGTIVAK